MKTSEIIHKIINKLSIRQYIKKRKEKKAEEERIKKKYWDSLSEEEKIQHLKNLSIQAEMNLKTFLARMGTLDDYYKNNYYKNKKCNCKCC